MEAEGDVDGADVGDRLQVRDAGTLQVRGGGGFAHVYPADGLVSVDEVHRHGLLGGDGMEPGQGATQCSAADVVEVGDQQHGQAVHRLWGGGGAGREECERASIKGEEERGASPTIFGFAGAVVWLQQVTLHTATGVRALSVRARLAASPVHIALVKI